MALIRADLGYWADQVLEEDAVQPSDESQRTAPPEGSAAGHSSRAGEGMATPPSHYTPDNSPNFIERVIPASVQFCTFSANLHWTKLTQVDFQIAGTA